MSKKKTTSKKSTKAAKPTGAPPPAEATQAMEKFAKATANTGAISNAFVGKESVCYLPGGASVVGNVETVVVATNMVLMSDGAEGFAYVPIGGLFTGGIGFQAAAPAPAAPAPAPAAEPKEDVVTEAKSGDSGDDDGDLFDDDTADEPAAEVVAEAKSDDSDDDDLFNDDSGSDAADDDGDLFDDEPAAEAKSDDSGDDADDLFDDEPAAADDGADDLFDDEPAAEAKSDDSGDDADDLFDDEPAAESGSSEDAADEISIDSETLFEAEDGDYTDNVTELFNFFLADKEAACELWEVAVKELIGRGDKKAAAVKMRGFFSIIKGWMPEDYEFPAGMRKNPASQKYIAEILTALDEATAE